ncbi:vacuolar protein sorting-associated protein 8 isoform X3 [Histomonas meleagridis]|uniref:vacuolar protein sorting-associated protein 8-like isoform X3 n=1 Tax=Histomonas meleagridis TaxID=135588 RepID=UPI00355A88BB|nr:vacuolar protein sorting-associated protein 8 isoform X3 [Histomonas meleagridis]KAH0804124.1 vacuolar protein sorting-associated protein 8-like isoform X3 [Histomonas meleagridis]
MEIGSYQVTPSLIKQSYFPKEYIPSKSAESNFRQSEASSTLKYIGGGWFYHKSKRTGGNSFGFDLTSNLPNILSIITSLLLGGGFVSINIQPGFQETEINRMTNNCHLGDIRVKFYYSDTRAVSVFAWKSHNLLTNKKVGGYSFGKIRNGKVPINRMEISDGIFQDSTYFKSAQEHQKRKMNFDIPINVTQEPNFKIEPSLSSIEDVTYNPYMACLYGRSPNSQPEIIEIETKTEEGQSLPPLKEYSPLPYVMFFGEKKEFIFSQIGEPRKAIEPITCATVSFTSYNIVAGHKSGNISIFDAKLNSLISKVDRTKTNSSGIVYITYAADDQSIIAVDQEKHVLHFTRLDSILAPKEQVLYQSEFNIKKVYMPESLSPYFIFSTRKGVYLYNSSEIDDNLVEIVVSPDAKINFICKNKADGTVILVAWYGSDLYIYSIQQFSGSMTPLFNRKFDAKIRLVSIIKNFGINVLFVDGTIDDITNYETKNTSKEHYETNEIKRNLKRISGIITYGELSYFFNVNKMFRMQYIPWNERLIGISRKGDFTTCFKMAKEIYSGNIEHYFGVDPDPSIRCNELQKIMFDIFYNSLCSLDQTQQVAQTFKTAIGINMSNFVVKAAYDYYKEENNLIFYFKALFEFGDNNLSKYIPFYIYETFINMANEQKLIDQADLAIIKTGIPIKYADNLLVLAAKNNMQKVLMKLWTDVYCDFVSPCIYFYKTDYFITYVEDLFLNNKFSKATSKHKEIVILWFCTSFGGTFPRLFVLFSKSQQKAPQFIAEFIKYFPIKLVNDKNFEVENFCNIIIQTVISFNQEIRNKCIDEIADAIVKNDVKISPICLQTLFGWAFSTNGSSISIRETIIITLNTQYPQIVKFENIIDYCEAAGFSTIVNIMYRKSKDYKRIIHAMALSEERRELVFDYIQNPYQDPFDLLHIEGKDENSGKSIKAAIQQSLSSIGAMLDHSISVITPTTGLLSSVGKKFSKSKLLELHDKKQQNTDDNKKENEEEEQKSDQESVSESESSVSEYESESSSSSYSSKKEIKADDEVIEEPETIEIFEPEPEKVEEPPKLCDELMENAVIENFPLLLLINASKAAELLAKYFPDYHATFLKMDIDPFIKFLYLRALSKSEYKDLLTHDNNFDLLTMMCKFAPKEVLPMIKASQDISVEDALRVCKQYRVIDTCMHIHTLRGDIQAAVNLVAEEIEAVLVEAIQKGGVIYAPSVDLVKEAPELKKAYETVLVTFDLMSKAPKVGQLLDRMWKDTFLAFQLPLYLACKCPIPETKNAITLFFAFFVVEALQRTSPENVFHTLKSDFCSIDQIQYRKVLSAVFKYLDYNQMLSNTVIELLLEDCIQLYKKANVLKTRAAFAYNPVCVMCNTPITGAGGIGGLIFECGHLYHNNSKCGQYRKKCPLCRNEMSVTKQNDAPPIESAHSQSMKLRKMLRVEFGLRRHYGKDQDLSQSGNNIFFMSDFQFTPKTQYKLELPEKIPEEKQVYLEL